MLLGGNESLGPVPDTPGWDDLMAGYERFGELAADAILAGEALGEAATSTTVRPGGEDGPLVTAGPFAETVEALGGFYVLAAEDLDAAVALAAEIPAATTGWVGVRPLVRWRSGGDAPAGAHRWFAPLYGTEGDAHRPGTPANDAAADAHRRFAEASGPAVLAGGALCPLDTAVAVRVRDGRVQVADGVAGPADALVGGFYVLAAPDTVAAVDLAAAVPVGAEGAVELRPVMELG